MKKLTKKIAHTSQLAVMIAMMAALTLSGVSAAERIFSADDAGVEGPDRVTGRIEPDVEAGPVDDTSENMATNGKPNCEPSACFLVGLVLKNDNTDYRLKTGKRSSSEIHAPPVAGEISASVLTTSCLIDSDLGRQFTLVGARPSGTS